MKEKNRMKIRRCVLLGLWLLSLTAISLSGGAVSYGIFFGVTLVPVISLFYIACVYLHFKIYQEVESRDMVCGQPMPYFFVLQNEDYFAFTSIGVRLFSSFSYVEELPGNIEYELLPGDKFTYRTKLVCRYRGEYEVGVKEVVLTDFFRLFRIRYSIPGTIKALVRPRLVYLPELNSIADIQALLLREAFAGAEPDVAARDYMEGDSIKQIHWKATARERKLKTRIRTGEEKQGICVFCDTKRYSRDIREYLPLENKILEALLALGLFLAQKGVAFTVFWGQKGRVKSSVRNIGDFDTFYQSTAELDFREEDNLQEMLTQAMAQGETGESKIIFCILHELNGVIMDMTERIAANGTVVVIYAVTDRNQEDYVRQSSERRRIVAVPIEAGLEGIL